MLPEEVTNFIGTCGEVKIHEVEKGAIKKFADAVGDSNPLYWDDEYARNSRYGSIIAPPGFFGWPTRWEIGSTQPPALDTIDRVRVAIGKAGYPRRLAGGIEYELFIPIRAGDTLAASPMVKDIVELEGGTGKLVLLIIETTYINQNGDVVAKSRVTSINR